ncbi:uncharacterized protein HMPREF1541_03460 [Cyphellophora europaea CBS 101466]|uniref:Signal recognition particle subunit SRP14 n=1 Tax=Cyphellophora europaea (strain CBS 101466) TaxID=1220924 RepID=W2S0Q4_CYPE1|nr:uncharacterized protein HMPREF1541_03460 [Cyphellophora europaea CBS 101466]ETN41524.1 hypothetical protein HMPREF1541_03460 [Cyphellophora europaea CBS 101466]
MAEANRLSNADFLSRLADLFASTHTANHGSVFLTQKPYNPNSFTSDADADTTSDETEQPPSSQQILVRATNGLSSKPRHGVKKSPAKTKPKVKISTVVDAGEVEGFFARYADVCKGGMQGLRKRDRKKGKKKAKGKGGK